VSSFTGEGKPWCRPHAAIVQWSWGPHPLFRSSERPHGIISPQGSVSSCVHGTTSWSPVTEVDRHRGSGHPPTPATPPCVQVRTRRFDRLHWPSSASDGRPSDRKYALDRPIERALARARHQEPRPLPAVLRASRGAGPPAVSTSLGDGVVVSIAITVPKGLVRIGWYRQGGLVCAV
jgi:hypothetical protein